MIILGFWEQINDSKNVTTLLIQKETSQWTIGCLSTIQTVLSSCNHLVSASFPSFSHYLSILLLVTQLSDWFVIFSILLLNLHEISSLGILVHFSQHYSVGLQFCYLCSSHRIFCFLYSKICAIGALYLFVGEQQGWIQLMIGGGWSPRWRK